MYRCVWFFAAANYKIEINKFDEEKRVLQN